MTVVSIGEAVTAASSLFRFGFRGALPAPAGALAAAASRDDEDEDGEPDPLFQAVEEALRRAGYLDA